MANLEKGMFSTHRVFYDPRTSTFTPQQNGTFRITESSKNMNNLGEKYKTSLPVDKKTGNPIFSAEQIASNKAKTSKPVRI